MNVLLVEDSAIYRHILSTQLVAWNYSVQAVPDAESALPLIKMTDEPLLLLIDWELPGMSGLELLAEVRRLPRKHYPYVLMLTGRNDVQDLVTALNAGADDYIAKPGHEQELRARIRVAERTLAVHERLVNANERLEYLASQDPLTNLLNRRAFMSAFHRELLAARRKKSPLCIVMCDIDRFKRINDTHGHTVGDEVIKLVAQALQSSCRGSDTVARLGGDEFVLLLPESHVSGVDAFVHRVQEWIRDRTELTDVPISLSFGIAAVDLEKTEKPAMVRVDGALYRAKREGRNRYCVAGLEILGTG